MVPLRVGNKEKTRRSFTDKGQFLRDYTKWYIPKTTFSSRQHHYSITQSFCCLGRKMFYITHHYYLGYFLHFPFTLFFSIFLYKNKAATHYIVPIFLTAPKLCMNHYVPHFKTWVLKFCSSWPVVWHREVKYSWKFGDPNSDSWGVELRQWLKWYGIPQESMYPTKTHMWVWGLWKGVDAWWPTICGQDPTYVYINPIFNIIFYETN